MLARLLHLLVATWALLAAFAAVTAQGGRLSPLLDLFAHFAPLYLLAGLLLGLIELLTARRAFVLGACVAAGLGGAALMAPEALRPPPIQAARGDGPPLTLIQFNAQRTNRNHAAIVDWIVAQRPDVVMIEEATPALRDRLLKRTGWTVVGRLTTVMIFSPHPLTGMGVRPDAPALGAPTWVNGRMDGPWGPLPLLAVHVPWPTEDLDDRVRPILTRVVAALGPDRLIFAGDFNSTPWSSARRAQDAAFAMPRATHALPTWPTWLGRLAPFPIDHVYVGERWTVTSLERGPDLGSDHYPLLVRLAPRD